MIIYSCVFQKMSKIQSLTSALLTDIQEIQEKYICYVYYKRLDEIKQRLEERG